ncbi:hypothetical protein K435DRAFT_65747 [Dendrothele bispora CBS 962.96]|uniref:Uncharacterized protein n=1 Tax=Dendrothele bispora (strain CBS 962.96) TaxID=1314807 RepID=A0A4S8KS08_DENBC|nr:hypothetical protein K435DRAFT_65747 [Dendrothele bispora CBS 962.96]
MIQCPKCNSPIFQPRALVDSDDSQKILQRLRDPAQVAEEETVRIKQVIYDAESEVANYDHSVKCQNATAEDYGKSWNFPGISQ